MEKWKYFHESKRYNWYVSNQGRVRKVSKTTEYDRIVELSLSGGHTSSRYYCFALNDMPEKYLHRLVAKMFIDNPESKRTVNHIDGNKLNNHVDNLEWSTYTENMLHASRTGLRVYKKNPEVQKRKDEYAKKVLANKAYHRKRMLRAYELRASGLIYSEIAKIMDITQGNARRLVMKFKIY